MQSINAKGSPQILATQSINAKGSPQILGTLVSLEVETWSSGSLVKVVRGEHRYLLVISGHGSRSVTFGDFQVLKRKSTRNEAGRCVHKFPREKERSVETTYLMRTQSFRELVVFFMRQTSSSK